MGCCMHLLGSMCYVGALKLNDDISNIRFG